MHYSLCQVLARASVAFHWHVLSWLRFYLPLMWNSLLRRLPLPLLALSRRRPGTFPRQRSMASRPTASATDTPSFSCV